MPAPWRASVLLAALAGCGVGEGDGWLEATVWAPRCDLEGEAYDMRPSFFASEPQEGDALVVRVQRGSDSPEVSDGLLVQVMGASEIEQALLGTPIDLAEGADGVQVLMTLYLNATCPLQLEQPSDRPVVYTAMAGSIVFDAIHAPEGDGEGTQIRARFDGVELADPHDPERLRATASGEFEFFHASGRPAQPFP